MSKLSYKTLLIIFFSLLIAIIVLWKFVLPKQKVSAAWWNDGWNYRKAVSISNSTSFDATNIPYKITLDTASLITAGKLQADADDIRIVDQYGKIVRSQVEKKTLNTSTTRIWFEATVKSNRSSSYYIYYGNSSATAPTFESDINTFSSTSTSATIEMKDGFGYTTATSNGGRITNIRKNSTSLGINGNIPYSTSYPGAWWNGATFTQTILNSTGPLFVEVTYDAGATGSYSSSSSTTKVFDNGFAETQFFVTYNTSGSENFYYYLSFDTGTRNSVWVDASGTLIDQATNSGTLYETNLGQNWFGQRWTSTGNYGGTIITKNGSDWQYGATSAQASYYQTNYSYSQSFTSGSSREVRFGVFAGNGGLSEMQQKGANYGGLNSSSSTEEVGGGPIAYWKFDEGIGTTALNSANSSYTSTITGATWQTEDQCLSGKCLYFNGSSYVNTNFGINRDISINPISVSMWVKPTSAGNYMFLSPNQGTNQRFYFSTYNGKWDMGIQNSGWGGSGSINVDLNKWSHIEIVTTGSVAYMYVNGKITSQKNYTSFTFPENLYIGIHGSSGAYGWVGYIDDVKIYPYARSATQIKQDYNSRGSLNGSSVNLGVQSSTAPSLNSKLVAYYKFDEGTGTTTKSSTNPTSSISLGSTNPPTWITGKFNKALSFNTNSVAYYASAYTSSLEYTGASNLSFSVWINPSNNETDGGQIISKPWNGSGVYNYYLFYNSDHTLRVYINGATSYSITTTNTIAPNQWHHIVFTLDNNQNINIYIDGKLSKTGTGNISSWSVTNLNVPLTIGCIYPYTNYCNAGTSMAFNGLIDEVKIYNTALTPDEVKQDYNTGAATQFGATNQTIGGTTTSLEYCIPGDTSYCANPIAEWKMDEKTGTTIKDISGNNNTGTFGTGNSAPTWTSGKIGAGLNFSGSSQYTTIEDSTSLKPTTSITTEAWFNTTNKSLNQRMLSKTSSGGYSLSINENSACVANTLCFLININGTYYSATYPSNNLSNNTWYHVAGSYDGTTVRLFLNGSNIGTTALISNTITNNTAKLCIGSESASTNCYSESGFFSGKIDHVKIYDYARTPAQIAYDYNKGAPVGWWKFDDCQGLTAFDSSGLGNNAAISIGPSGTQNSTGTCQIGTSAAWTNGATGKYNSSLNFDGNDDYVCMSNVFRNDDLSLSAWIKTSSDGAIVGNNYGNAPTFWHGGLSVTSGKATMEIGYITSYRTQSGTSNVNNNKWHHLVMTSNSSGSILYVDGKQEATSIYYIGQVPGNSEENTCIGVLYRNCCGALPYRFFNGQIDDVRVYNYALTSEQIKTVYNNGAVNFN